MRSLLSRLSRPQRYLLFALLIIVVDQAVKLLVKLNMQQGQGDAIGIIPGFFQIYFIENKGAAFGVTISSLLSPVMDISEVTGKIILTVLSLLLMAFIARYLLRVAHYGNKLPVYVALILGGALGNIIDRVFYGVWFNSINDYEGGWFMGRVVDMFYFDIYNGPVAEWVPLLGGSHLFLWPIFNIADTAISVGILGILIWQKKLFAPGQKDEPTAQKKEATVKEAPAKVAEADA